MLKYVYTDICMGWMNKRLFKGEWGLYDIILHPAITFNLVP